MPRGRHRDHSLGQPSNPEGLHLDGPDDHPYTPDTLQSEPNCPSHGARETVARWIACWNGSMEIDGVQIGCFL